MYDAKKQSQMLANAAQECAIRNRNSSVGVDHLLYAACSTEEGRRMIENKGGDYNLILNYLKHSFMSRAEADDLNSADFSDACAKVLSGPYELFKTGRIDAVRIKDILESIIANADSCWITRSALIRGRIVDEDAQIMEENAEFDEHMKEAAERVSGHRSDEGSVGDDAIGAGDSHEAGMPAQPQEEQVEPQRDPQEDAVLKALRNLSKVAEAGNLDPVIGRDAEIDAVIDILQRRRKGSALLVGAPGVGKTAIAEGVAQLLYDTDTPASVASRPVFEVSVSDLVAGTRYRGDFESRLRILIRIAKETKAILFVDEAHMLMGAGVTAGNGMDAANILKPALARGEVKIIAATTPMEARVIRKDKALMRRFEEVFVAEPSKDASVAILEGVEEFYSDYHGIAYEDGVAERCVALSMRHMPDRNLPDKAFDIFDAAAVEAKNAGASYVSEEFAIKAVSKITGVNAGLPTAEEIEISQEFSSEVRKKIFGQDEAVGAVAKAVRRSLTGVSRLGVAGSFLFNGPTGTGKSAMAKATAEALKVPLVRIDMSEHMEAHSVSGLIGAPPGYVGYDDEGKLIAAAASHPRMVLLLDEIEKAHPNVYDILLQVLDYGRLTSSDGRTVSFRGAYIIATGNIGAAVGEKAAIGFGRQRDEKQEEAEALSKTFRKELLKRFTDVIHFEKLDTDAMGQMANAEIDRVIASQTERGLRIVVTDDLRDMIAAEASKTMPDGRSVQEVVDAHLSDPLSDFLVENLNENSMKMFLQEGKTKVAPVFH